MAQDGSAELHGSGAASCPNVFGHKLEDQVAIVAATFDVIARRLAEVGRADDEELEAVRPGPDPRRAVVQ